MAQPFEGGTGGHHEDFKLFWPDLSTVTDSKLGVAGSSRARHATFQNYLGDILSLVTAAKASEVAIERFKQRCPAALK